MWRLIVSRPWSAVTMRVCGAGAPDWDVAAAGAIAPRSTDTARMRIIFATSLIVPLLASGALGCVDRARRTLALHLARIVPFVCLRRISLTDAGRQMCLPIGGGVGCRGNWSGRQDSNLRLPAPKAGALPG